MYAHACSRETELTGPAAVLGNIHFINSQLRENERAQGVAPETEVSQDKERKPRQSYDRGPVEQAFLMIAKELSD